MQLPDFMTEDPDGEVHFTGLRLGLYTLVRCYREEGWSPERIAEEYPSLSLALVYKALAFYLENRAEVDAYVAQYDADLDRLEAAPPGPGVLKAREVLAARQKSGR